MGASFSSFSDRVALLTLLSGASIGCFFFRKAQVRRRMGLTPTFPLNPNPKPKGKLLFASQTGNPSVLPHRLRSILSYHSIDVDLIDCKDYRPEDLPKESLVLIVAFTGKDGNPPDRARNLARWLSKRAEDPHQLSLLSGCRFAVFGVGSRSKGQAINTFARDLVRWMESLRAFEISPIGEEDEDSKELEDVFTSWASGLVLDIRALPEEMGILNSRFYEDCMDIDIMDGTGVKIEERQAKPNGEMVPITARSQENKKRILEQGCIFYVLLDHINHKLSANHRLEKSDVLTVASLYRIRVAAKDKIDDSATQPLGSPVFNFTSDKYPSGMGCGAVGCKLFFVGGQFHDTKSTTDGHLGWSNKIYILDTSSIENSITEYDISKMIEAKDSMNFNKYDPIVVTVKDKLFVLPNNFGSNGTNPTIESYDPARDRWECFDIFEIYKGSGYLKKQPPQSPFLKVLAHCVKDSIIYVFLVLEAYAFDVDTGNLYLAGCHHPSQAGPPFGGMGVYVDGFFLGIDSTRTHLCAYDYNPFKGRPDVFGIFKYLLISPRTIYKFDYKNMQAIISNLGGMEEGYRLLAVRTARLFDNEQVHKESYLVFDFLSVVEKVKGALTCKTDYSITYHMDNWNNPCHYIKACFCML